MSQRAAVACALLFATALAGGAMSSPGGDGGGGAARAVPLVQPTSAAKLEASPEGLGLLRSLGEAPVAPVVFPQPMLAICDGPAPPPRPVAMP